jgi:hypothetical protein
VTIQEISVSFEEANHLEISSPMLAEEFCSMARPGRVAFSAPLDDAAVQQNRPGW